MEIDEMAERGCLAEPLEGASQSLLGLPLLSLLLHGRLLVESALLELLEDALLGHLVLQGAESLFEVVVSYVHLDGFEIVT